MDWFFIQWGQLWSITNISSVFKKEGKKASLEDIFAIARNIMDTLNSVTNIDTIIHHCQGQLMIKKLHLNNNFKNSTFGLNHQIAALDQGWNEKAPLPQPGFCKTKVQQANELGFWRNPLAGASKRKTLPSESTCSEQLTGSPESGTLVHTRPLHLGPKSHEIVLDYHRLLTPGQQSGSEERSLPGLMHVLWVQTGRKKMRLSTITENLAASLILSTKPSPHAKAAGWRKCLWERTRSISSSKPCTLWCDCRKWRSHRK